MKAKCEKCERTIEGQAHNVFILCDGKPGWVPFMDGSRGLTTHILCPDHSPPLIQAARILTDLFGEPRMSAIHLSGIILKHATEQP